MKRKNYWLLFAILLLSLTSLSPSLDFTKRDSQSKNNNTSSQLSLDSPNPDKDDRPIQISVQMSRANFNKLELLNNRFVQETGIQAHLTNMPEDLAYDEVSKALAIGEGPDVILMENEWVKSFATKGFLLPVESYRKSAPGSDVLRLLLPSVEWNGYQWAKPFDMDPYVLVWQRNTLAEMGITQPPKTLDEWTDLLSKQEDREGKALIGMDADEPYALATLMADIGANVLQPEDEQLLWIDQVIPHIFLVNNDTKQQAWQQLKDGELAMLLSPFSEVSSSTKNELSIKTPEQFIPSFLSIRSFGVSSQSTMPEDSSEWIAYMTSYVMQEEWLIATKRLPSLSVIYENLTAYTLDIPFRLDLLEESSHVNADSEQLTNASWTTLSDDVHQLLTDQITSSQFKEARISGRIMQTTLDKE